jgi:nondiscriminating aspartyl-tRNA synthetase
MKPSDSTIPAPNTLPRTLIADLPSRIGHEVRLQGFLHNVRRLGTLNFVVLRDRTGLAQVRADADEMAPLTGLPDESVLEVTGTASAEPRAPGGIELVTPRFFVLAAATAPPPVVLSRRELKASLPFLLDHAAVSLRHEDRRQALALMAALAEGFRSTLRELGFTEVFTPKIAAATAEGGAEVFPLEYFDVPAYLTQSPQLYKQMLVGVLERVFEVGPVFRAEPHDTGRHLAQYCSLDAEMGFIDTVADLIATAREALAGMMAAAAARIPGQEAVLMPDPLPSLPFWEAMTVLEAAGVRQPGDRPDLTPAGERHLGEWARAELASDFLVVTGYPQDERPFYTHPDPHHPGYSRGFDILFRGLEIVTGGQRLHREADYLRVMAERGMDPSPFEAYLEAFRHGMPPHGGFAIGLERVAKQWLGVANIREVTAFPRYRGRLAP